MPERKSTPPSGLLPCSGAKIDARLRFMQNTFPASGIVAVVAGLVGYFLVLRVQTFAGHALGNIGFTGATGAVLIGVSPLWGLVVVTVAGGVGMGVLGERMAQRDVAIGMVLALGLGLLFLHFFTADASQATSLLLGNVLGVDAPTLWALAALGVICLAGLGAIARPLLFASLQPELGEAKGVGLRLIGVLFLGVTAVAVSESVQIVGVLLVFTLLVESCRRPANGHAARARPVAGSSSRPGRGVARPDTCLLYRLADQFLDHGIERRRVFARILASTWPVQQAKRGRRRHGHACQTRRRPCQRMIDALRRPGPATRMLQRIEALLDPTAGEPEPPPTGGLTAFYWHFARQARGSLAALFVAGLCVAALDTMMPYFVGRVVSIASTHRPETVLARRRRPVPADGGGAADPAAHRSAGAEPGYEPADQPRPVEPDPLAEPLARGAPELDVLPE